MTARRLTLAVCAAALAACGPPPPVTSGGIAPQRALAGAILRDDRVTLSRGTVVRAVGVSRRWVYAATADAVIVYDRDRRAWLAPFSRDGGFEPSLVRAIAVDPDDDSAWLLTATGAWSLQPFTAFVTRAPAGPLPARARVGSLDAVYREFPSLQSFAPLLTRDAATLQGYAVIAGARAPDRTEVWLGTAGGGLLQVDPLFSRATPVPYGLAVSGVGAMARAADGVWMAPASRALEPRSAITFVTADLQQWRWVDDAARGGFGGGRATALAVHGGTMWMGTTRGLFRLAVDGTGARAFTPMAGLPSDVVLSLLVRDDGVWVGTERGLVFLPSDSAGASAARALQAGVADVPVRALLATGDTLWIGTEAGLVLRPPGADGRVVRPAASALSSRLRQGVRALARADSMVFVAMPDGVMAFSLARGAWSEPWPAVAWGTVGEIGTMAADARTVWVGGAFGVLAVDRATGVYRILHAGSDLPDVVTSLVLDGDHAWIATLGGVVRVRRSADGLFP